LAATGAFAQSSVTISGLVDIGYQNVNAEDNTKDSNKIAQNGSATTTINIAGTEDLGGGLKGNFRVEFNPDLVNGTGVSGVNAVSAAATGGMHQTFVGVSGGFGEVKLGRLNTPALSAWGTGSVFGTALGSGYSAGQNIYNPTSAAVLHTQTYPTRFNGAIEYTTPSFSGLTARLYAVPKNDNSTTSTSNNAGVTDLGLAYNNGPLNVAFSSQTIKTGTKGLSDLVVPANGFGALAAGESGKLQQNTLAANYNFGAATVYAAYWTTKVTSADTVSSSTDLKRQGTMLGAKYAVSNTVDLMASYGKTADKIGEADAKIFGLGADYKLSARTALYARYADLDTATNAANKGSKTTAIGVRHTF
jgi:predicted porin